VGIHQNFGINLRTQCQKFQSIAEACRAININRQQFNKYLSGAMLPNARTLQRICEVFGTEEWELFLPAQKQQPAPIEKTTPQLGSEWVEFTKKILSHRVFAEGFKASTKPNIQPGLYKCFFPLMGFSGCLVQSAVLISNASGISTFSRHTRLSSPSSPQYSVAHGKHRGIVLSNGTFDYLIGYNTVSPNNISMMCLPRDVTGGPGMRIGLAMIQGLSPLAACRVAMLPITSSFSEKRNALNKNSIIRLAVTEQDKTIAKILHTPQSDGSAQLTHLDFHDLLLGNNSRPTA
jgi:transcriptional regulator with XRE-family HTH domain